MDISTLTPKKQVKIQFWLKVIKECRASGLTNRDWCEQNNIHLKQYFVFSSLTLKLRFLGGLSTDVREVSALVCGHGRLRHQSLQ